MCVRAGVRKWAGIAGGQVDLAAAAGGIEMERVVLEVCLVRQLCECLVYNLVYSRISRERLCADVPM